MELALVKSAVYSAAQNHLNQEMIGTACDADAEACAEFQQETVRILETASY